MQYILSEEEMTSMRERAMKGDKAISVEALQELCTFACNHIPCERDWDEEDKSPWGCILTEEGEWYCDDCPVQGWCPTKFKSWSK